MTAGLKWAKERIPIMVRLPNKLHARLKARARKNNKSLNAEIIMALEQSLLGEDPVLDFVNFIRPELVQGLIQQLKKAV